MDPVVCFYEFENTYVFVTVLRFFKNLLESEILFCSATAKTKTALGILHVLFNYLGASFFKELGIHLPREAKEREMSRWLVHSLLSPCLCMGIIVLVCQSTSALPVRQATLHT